ncbi:ABC transporter ATP-binding protein [Pararhizobium mangrovi]|uniref:Spermidine/putrescine import ATP-binding protein PotA n=1 Tax=Pararhizobium mangrovi TaxID=2590452 RepID=A0A506U4F8_9HYPH|nr:ABC transporter ATP-binding protein [Pararhizobium mangrovi]TPW27429.1 ABC transporter ATP-binding protein [Pararhizobium mangrovi]
MRERSPERNPQENSQCTRTHDAAIDIRRVRKSFGTGANAFVALKEVSAAIRRGEFFTLLGPSGCGKTTLLRLIAGFDQPTSGDILLDGEDISQLAPFHRPVNTVFQNYALFPHMSVAQNIGFGLKMQGKSKAEIDDRVDAMLTLVQMQALKSRRTGEISGGQQQRVALARALAPAPKLLLLDEPLSALDLKLRKEMQIELKRLQNETGITFVFVTHDQEEALTMSDRIAVMDHGSILQIGTPREIYDHPKRRFVADFIGDINFIEATAVTDGGQAGARIPGHGFVRLEDDRTLADGETMTLAIRPERVEIVPSKALDHIDGPRNEATNELTGKLVNVVYHGTDTIYHFTLADGTVMRARTQNNRGFAPRFSVGDAIGWRVDPSAISIVEDAAA